MGENKFRKDLSQAVYMRKRAPQASYTVRHSAAHLIQRLSKVAQAHFRQQNKGKLKKQHQEESEISFSFDEPEGGQPNI
jgi:hypothetical protein